MAERYIPEHRRTQFKAKNTFKPEELRRRREEQQVEIRKAKREENLAKRRGIGTGENRPGASLGAAPDSDDENPPTESQVCCCPFLLPISFAIACLALQFRGRTVPTCRWMCFACEVGGQNIPSTPHSSAHALPVDQCLLSIVVAKLAVPLQDSHFVLKTFMHDQRHSTTNIPFY
jgi:hypothetical protein